MDHSLEHHREYIGKRTSDLPSPALVISLPVVKANIAALHKDVEELGLGFRPHVKTLKVSTRREIVPQRKIGRAAPLKPAPPGVLLRRLKSRG